MTDTHTTHRTTHRTRTNLAAALFAPVPDYDDAGLLASSQRSPRRLRDAVLESGRTQPGQNSSTDWEAAVGYQVAAESAAKNGDHISAYTLALLAAGRTQLVIAQGVAQQLRETGR